MVNLCIYIIRDKTRKTRCCLQIASAIEHPPIPYESISPAVKDLLLRCLEMKRKERPPAKDLLKHPLFTMQSAPPKNIIVKDSTNGKVS